MREILFRGFHPCDGPDTIVVDGEKVKGRWAQGYFFQIWERTYNEVFKMGPTRAKTFADAFSSALTEIATMSASDGKSDKELWFTKSKLDERLKQICGENFRPWEERYR